MHTKDPLMPTTEAPFNKGFSIDSNNIIHWASNEPKKEVHFSTKSLPTTIYAEICSSYGHLDGDELGGNHVD